MTTETKVNLELVLTLRAKGMQNNQEIEFLDFGAGNPSDKRTEQEMKEGKATTTTVAKLSSIGLKNEWSEWIYNVVLEKKPKVVLELGTCCGFSAITMALASKESQIYTLEGAKTIAELAKNNIKEAGVQNITQVIGRFSDTLPDLLAKIAPIDFAFIDGHHDKDATLKYFEQIRPFMSQNAIMAFDDISWSDGMKEAWLQIKSCIKQYEDLGKIGVCYL
ncbi:MAG: hypothetical protein RL154_1636 [Pseudomonadota bacterium]|jgi:predicted O-methyltransferase YrrM